LREKLKGQLLAPKFTSVHGGARDYAEKEGNSQIGLEQRKANGARGGGRKRPDSIVNRFGPEVSCLVQYSDRKEGRR